MPNFTHASRPLTFVRQLAHVKLNIRTSTKVAAWNLAMWWSLRGSTLDIGTRNILGISSAALMATRSSGWGQRGRKGHQRWTETTSTCATSSGTSLCSEASREKSISKTYSTGERRTSRTFRFSNSSARAQPPLHRGSCLPEADRKEGAQLLASHPSMSQLAESAGQEAWRNKLLSSRLQ